MIPENISNLFVLVVEKCQVTVHKKLYIYRFHDVRTVNMKICSYSEVCLYTSVKLAQRSPFEHHISVHQRWLLPLCTKGKAVHVHSWFIDISFVVESWLITLQNSPTRFE